MITSKIRRGLAASCFLFLLVTAVLSQQIPEPRVQTRESNKETTPAMALDLLKAGNARFVRGTPISRPIRQQFRDSAKGQYPIATILSCQDSRTSSELLFDLNNGDAFTIKIAGNVLSDDILGGLEFGVLPQYGKVIVVMGHTNCGAVTGTIATRAAIDRCSPTTFPCPGIEPPALVYILRKIRPALDKVDPNIKPRDESNPTYVNAAAKENVKLVMAQILNRSGYISSAIREKRVELWGAMHDLSSGEVTFFQK